MKDSKSPENRNEPLNQTPSKRKDQPEPESASAPLSYYGSVPEHQRGAKEAQGVLNRSHRPDASPQPAAPLKPPAPRNETFERLRALARGSHLSAVDIASLMTGGRIEAKIDEALRRIEARGNKGGPKASGTSESTPSTRRDALPAKARDLSHYFDQVKLTEAQREAISLSLEYELSVTAIARRLQISRKSVDERIEAAKRKIEAAGAAILRAKKHATNNSG